MLKRLKKNRRGFTLIELMIVVSIIGILAAIAVPNYQWGIIKAREAVFRENLYNIRTTLDQFYADQGKYPDALPELVEKKYLPKLPNDITGNTESWNAIPPEPPGEGQKETQGNVADVKSGSSLVGSNGVPYSEW